MKSIKDETDQLYGIIHKFENATLEANRIANEVFRPKNSSSFQFLSKIQLQSG